MSTLRPMITVLPRPERRGSKLVFLTAVVLMAHLLLMGLIPWGIDGNKLPLDKRFSVRTIVIAPAAATGGGSAGAASASDSSQPSARLQSAAAADAQAKAKANPKPKPKPRPKPQPPAEGPDRPAAATPEAPADPAGTDAGAAAGSEGGPPAAAPEAPAGGGGEGTGRGEGEGAGAGAGVPGARNPLKVPGSTRLDFAATGQQGTQPMSGLFGELEWLQDGNQYNARLEFRVLFKTVRSQTSIGRVGPGGLEPTVFSDSRRNPQGTKFLRDGGQIVFGGGMPSVPLQPGAQDELSIIMQLSALLGGDPERYGPGSTFSMQAAGPRAASVWSFSVDGDEAVETPAGTYRARRLTRLPRQAQDRKIELWLAPDVAWLPVRIRQTEPNGDWADLQLRKPVTVSSGG